MDWIDDIEEHILQYSNGRKIIFWGKGNIPQGMKDRLEERKLEFAGYVDNNIKNVNGCETKSPEILNGNADKYYVVITLSVYSSLRKQLESYGYKKNVDYYYFSDCIVEDTEEYYEDEHGNKIIGRRNGLKFAFSGFNSTIYIGKNTYVGDLTIYIHTDCKAVIGGESDISGNIYIYNSSDINIGERARIRHIDCYVEDNVAFFMEEGADIRENTIIAMSSGSYCKIGLNFRVMKNSTIKVKKGTRLEIGDDCLLSSDVALWTNDSHAIFDVNTGENINSGHDICAGRRIVIGNHVWIGYRVTLLYNTNIGDGSIIGANSLVKHQIPNNCIAAGIPAKVIRTDVTWCEKEGIEEIEEIEGAEKKYARMTE